VLTGAIGGACARLGEEGPLAAHFEHGRWLRLGPWARRPRLPSPPHAQHDEASELRLPQSGWQRPRAGRGMSRARSSCQPQQGSAPCVPDGVGSDETSQQHPRPAYAAEGEDRKAGALALHAPVPVAQPGK